MGLFGGYRQGFNIRDFPQSNKVAIPPLADNKVASAGRLTETSERITPPSW